MGLARLLFAHRTLFVPQPGGSFPPPPPGPPQPRARPFPAASSRYGHSPNPISLPRPAASGGYCQPARDSLLRRGVPQHRGRNTGASLPSAGRDSRDGPRDPLAARLYQRRRIRRRILSPHSLSRHRQGGRPQGSLETPPPSAPAPAGPSPPPVGTAGFPGRDCAPTRKLVRAEPVSTWDQLGERSRGRVSRSLLDVGLSPGGRAFRPGLP